MEIVLDWEHRYHYMQMHTAQHVASGLLFHHFSIATVSVHQGERILTIETDSKEIPLSVCYALEDLVNQSVRETKPVSYEVHSQQSAQALDLRRSIKVEGDGVRLVVVDDIDTVACGGGLHVANTKEIDLFHYEGQEMIRGHVRLIFTIGAIAREEIRRKERIIEQLGALFSSPVEELVETASKAVTQASSDKSALKKCNERLAFLELEKRITGVPEIKGTPVVLWEVEEDLSLKDIGKAATAFENLALCAVQQNDEQVLWLIALVGEAATLLDFFQATTEPALNHCRKGRRKASSVPRSGNRGGAYSAQEIQGSTGMKLPVWLKSLFKKETYLKEDGSLDVRKLLLRTFLLMLFIFGLYFIGLRYYRLSGWDQNVVVQQFIENFGVHGVAIYVFIVDLFVLPLSVDLMWPFVMEWHPALAILVMGASSVAGAFFLPTSLGDLSALFPSSGSGYSNSQGPTPSRL